MCTDAPSKYPALNAMLLAVQEVGNSIYEPLKAGVLHLGRVAKDGYATDVALRAVSQVITLVDLEAKTECAAKPAMAAIKTTRGFFDATRVLQSVKYIVCGNLYKDFLAKKFLPIVTQAALAVGRAITTLHWFVEQKVLDFESLAKKAAAIGGKYGQSFVNAIKATTLMNGAFMVGLGGLVVSDIQAIRRGEHILTHAFSSVSLTTDFVSIALGFFNIVNPNAIAALAIVAATTGLVAWLTDPENK